MLLKNWRINRKTGEKIWFDPKKKGGGWRRFVRITFSQEEEEEKDRRENHWNAIRATGLRATRRFGRPTDSTRTRSSLLLPPHRYLSLSLPFLLSQPVFVPLQRSICPVSACRSSVPTLRGTRPVSSSEFNRRLHRDPMDPVSSLVLRDDRTRCVNSLALRHVLYNRHKILIDPFYPLLSEIKLPIYIFKLFLWLFSVISSDEIFIIVITYWNKFWIKFFLISIYKPRHDLKKDWEILDKSLIRLSEIILIKQSSLRYYEY